MKRCSKCQKEKPLGDFYFSKSQNRVFSSCKGCCTATVNSSRKKWQEKGLCRNCSRPAVPGKMGCQYHLDYAKRYNAKLRLAALNAYGGPICSCCDETQDAFLSIDHIEGKGCQHRKMIGVPSGTPFYAWLRRNGYPKGFRVLCANCNMAFSKLGYCPHEFETRDKSSSTVPVFENSDAISRKPALVN